MSKKVTYARTHQNLYVPGAGDLGSVFPPQTKTLDKLEMHANEEGTLNMSFAYRGIMHNLLIPSANIIVLSVVSEEKPTLKLTKPTSAA